MNTMEDASVAWKTSITTLAVKIVLEMGTTRMIRSMSYGTALQLRW